MDSLVQKFKNIFLKEAQEIIDSYESDLLKLEKNPDSTDTIESAFRSMHTLKGISGMYGFDYVNEITHKLEFIFQAVRDKKQALSKELFEITFSVVDHLRKLLFDEKMTDDLLQQEHYELMEKIDQNCIANISLQPDSISASEDKNSANILHSIWQIKLQATEAQFYRGLNFMNIFRDLAEIGLFAIERIQTITKSPNEIWSITLLTSENEEKIREVFMFIEDDCTLVHVADVNENDFNKFSKGIIEGEKRELSIIEAILPSINQKKVATETQGSALKASFHEMKRISVTAEKLDYLMYLVSELITINSQISLSLKQNNQETLKTNLEKIDTLSKNFRTNALELRLVPLNDMVLRFQRLIRDLSKQLGKKVDFQVFGGESELDKSTIEQLSDPLMHIIRNCLDHGIETPEQRLKQGKPETGILKLSAHHSGDKINITIEDDGNGIDLEKVRNKAINMGLLTPESQISKKELLDLIFLPGFSTAQNLTNVSGRGVGMDVVRKRIQELRGDVTIETNERVGTKFILTLQQSISIIDTLLFGVGGSFFTLPISEINLCRDIKKSDLDSMRQTSVLPFGDQLIPFVDLRQVLSLNGQYPPKVKLIIIKYNTQDIAILADTIIGEHQAVLKPVCSSVQTNKILSSVSQLGDGNMAFMIDTYELHKESRFNQTSK